MSGEQELAERALAEMRRLYAEIMAEDQELSGADTCDLLYQALGRLGIEVP